MRIYLGSDHRGFKLKEELRSWLIQEGREVVDLGAHKLNPDDDYVDFAAAVARAVFPSGHTLSAVSGKPPAVGILICGSGVGMDIVANRFRGIHSGLALSPDQVRAARNDDDINILAIAANYTDVNTAKEMVKSFLETEFSGEDRYIQRIKQIDDLLFG